MKKNSVKNNQIALEAVTFIYFAAVLWDVTQRTLIKPLLGGVLRDISRNCWKGLVIKGIPECISHDWFQFGIWLSWSRWWRDVCLPIKWQAFAKSTNSEATLDFLTFKKKIFLFSFPAMFLFLGICWEIWFKKMRPAQD